MADQLTKQGAREDQPLNRVTYEEKLTVDKPLTRAKTDIKILHLMEPDDKIDEAAKLSFTSKLALFKTIETSPTETKHEMSAREERRKSKPAFKVTTSSQVVSTTTQVSDIERSTSPRRESSPPSERKSPEIGTRIKQDIAEELKARMPEESVRETRIKQDIAEELKARMPEESARETRIKQDIAEELKARMPEESVRETRSTTSPRTRSDRTSSPEETPPQTDDRSTTPPRTISDSTSSPGRTPPQTDDRSKMSHTDNLPGSRSKSPQTGERLMQRFNEELRAKLEEVSERKMRGFTPNDMEVFKNPMRLISTDKENLLKIETKPMKQIARIEWPIVVVAIAGLYRTGKSYLMNRLAGSTQGFALGNTIESKTKGIWVWCKIHPTKPKTVLMLLDTEGLGDVKKGDPSHDNKIFTLATLLCNCLVYNMKGVLDQDALSKLTFVAVLAENIRFRGKDDSNRLTLILPDFVLCLRDFSLDLVIDDKTISEDEYLELSIAEDESKDKKVNKARESIRKYFPVRKCFTLPVPGDGDVLQKLTTLRFSDLSNKFKNDTNRFVSYINNCKPKELLASKPINGQMFTTLAEHYVASIRNGAVPDVDEAFVAAAENENKRAGQEAFEIFKNQMNGVELPVPSSVLANCYMYQVI